jgi:hypothetical protein
MDMTIFKVLKKFYARFVPAAACSCRDSLESGPDTVRGKGQGLVETALVLPIILLLLLGVFEVGWALRGYIVLANVNREAARFASRGIYLDVSEKDDPNAVGYEKVITHTIDSLADQLGMDFLGANPNASMIMTYYSVQPRNFQCPGGDSTCLNADGYSGHPGFDCERFDYESRNNPDPNYYEPGENLADVEYPVLIPPLGLETHPDLPDYYNQVLTLSNTIAVTAYHYHTGSPAFSRIDPWEKVQELRGQTNRVNCQLVQKGLAASSNDIIIIENIYFQDQLVSLPFVTAFVPDPVPFYTHTAMRLVTVREQAQSDGASVCEPYPVIVPTSKLSGKQPGDQVTIEVSNNPEVVPGNFSFLDWNGNPHATGELEDNFEDPGSAEFIEPDTDPEDDILNTGDWVSADPGVHNGAKDVIGALADPDPGEGTLMLLPVWSDVDCATGCTGAAYQGNDGRFRVATFVWVRLKEVNLTGNPAACPGSKCLIFEFVSPAPDACQCNPDEDGANCDPP